MERLGGVGTVVVLYGFAVGLVGLAIVIWRVRDDRRRTAGLRTSYAGMAMMCLGGSLFVLSRPAALYGLAVASAQAIANLVK